VKTEWPIEPRCWDATFIVRVDERPTCFGSMGRYGTAHSSSFVLSRDVRIACRVVLNQVDEIATAGIKL
jgi:hypothetical protein